MLLLALPCWLQRLFQHLPKHNALFLCQSEKKSAQNEFSYYSFKGDFQYLRNV